MLRNNAGRLEVYQSQRGDKHRSLRNQLCGPGLENWQMRADCYMRLTTPIGPNHPQNNASCHEYMSGTSLYKMSIGGILRRNKIEKKNAARRAGVMFKAGIVISENCIQLPMNTKTAQLRMT